MSFPKTFSWGAASASYQIEGGAFEDGKGLSIWDSFTHTPGKTFNGQTGDQSCDAYHRYEEDLDLLEELGIKNYRFSLSWPRVIPDGSGKVNPAGLAYYDRLVDGCLKRGITPWITLYHWDLPRALYLKGGWLNRDTAYAFSHYASVIVKHFSGRVQHFMTINEPQCVIGLGHLAAVHAPGTHLSDEDMFLSWHHLMLAHGLAVQAIRKVLPSARIGLASTGKLAYTCRRDIPTPEDLVQASFHTSEAEAGENYFFNHQWFLDPVCFGHYPEDPESPCYPFAAMVKEEDLEIISAPIDFIGLNIYNGFKMEPVPAGQDNKSTSPSEGTQENQTSPADSYSAVEKYPGYPRTALKWPVTPEILYWGPRLIYERYGLPMVIAENGQSCNDRIFLDEEVHDPDRIDFLHRYLLELKAAVEDGIPVTGYFHWSFTDNLEWHSGYDDRFGLIYIDYRNLRRIPKDSARWYSQMIRRNGSDL